MKCGCARNIKYSESFDDLGAHFELTTANGVEKAYRKAVDHLTRLLVEDNTIGAVTIKRILLKQTPGLLVRENAESARSAATGKSVFYKETPPFQRQRSPKV